MLVCALGLKVKILVFWGLSLEKLGGMEKPMYAVARASRDSNSLEKDEWFGLVLAVSPCYFFKKCGLSRPKQALKVKLFVLWG